MGLLSYFHAVFTDTFEIAVNFFYMIAFFHGFVYVGAAYLNVDDRVAAFTEEMMMVIFCLDVIARLRGRDGESVYNVVFFEGFQGIVDGCL